MKNKELIKKIILIVAVFVLLFLLWNFVLYPYQMFKHNEKILSEAGKRYFSINRRNLPTEEGRVSTVSLEVLIKQKYLDELKIKNSICDIKNSNVKLKVESGKDEYYTHLQCGNRHSNIDYKGPVITLNGKKNMTVSLGDTYTEPGVLSVKDKTDGTINNNEVVIKGTVDTSKIGTYEITYKVADSLDNETTVKRTVEVIESLSKVVTEDTKSTNNYYKGTSSDNFVMFNNILFRMVKINSDGTVTIASENPLANIDYGAKNNRFDGSNMDEWLNNYFYPQLNNKSKKLIVSSKWCDDIYTEGKTTCDRYSKTKNVGILSLQDYVNSLDDLGMSYLGIVARVWYNNFDSNNQVWSGKSNNQTAYKDNILLNIRPAITLKKDTKITSGSGTKEDPYLIGTEQEVKRNMKVNKLDIGTVISYSGYNFVVAGHEEDGTTKLIMKSVLRNEEHAAIQISYDNASSVKIYNPKEKGNIAYQINNNLSKYIDTSYFVKKDVVVPIYDKLVTYKGKHETKTYKSKLSIPSAFDLFSGATNNAGEPFWLIESSKEEENKTYVDADGTTPFYYKHVGRKVGVKLKVYLDKDAYIKSGNCRDEDCTIAK